MSSPRSAEVVGQGQPVRVALLGSTGSIGRQAVDVLVGDPAFRVVALAAGRNTALLAEQARRLRPSAVVLAAPDASLGAALPSGTAVEFGEAALVALATRDDVDLVVVATGGVVSLRPVLGPRGREDRRDREQGDARRGRPPRDADREAPGR